MIYKVINYESWKIHYANAARGDIAKTLPAEDVTAENWYHWRTLCGVELIGHVREDGEASCQRCIKAYEKAQRTAAALAARFGP